MVDKCSHAPSILPLCLRDVALDISERTILKSTNLEVPRGGVTAILGPNGAGKSVLLRLCHGLIYPTRGSVSWRKGNGAIDGRKRHTMVFQKPILLRRSALENLVHALKISGARDPIARSNEALDKFGLLKFSNQPARLMSGGEQQRLAIARAWALCPHMLFLDEPTSQLDPGSTRRIEEMVQAMKDEGCTIMMSTHDLGQARRLADRVLFIHQGSIIEDQPAREFFFQPKTETARAFLSGDLLW